MSAVLWMNIPLMVLAFGLITGIPLWRVIRRSDWHHKPETRAVPAYLARRLAPARVRVTRSAGYASRRPMRPATGGANS
ncbi:MAG TPA: hypothetical protein VF838_07970 [Trebonia sp.]